MTIARRLLAVVTIATAITLPHVSARADYVGPSSAPKYASAEVTLNNSCSADVIAGVADRRFRVWGFLLNSREVPAGNAATVRFQTSSGAVQTSLVRLTQGATINSQPAGSLPVFETTVTNSGLRICNTTSSSASFTVMFTYTEFDPTSTAKFNETFLSETADAFVTNTTTDRVPVDLDESDVGGGGGGGDVTLTAIEGDAFTFVDEWREIVKWAGGLGIFLLIGLLVFGRFPKKRLPL